jgi:hypothetical protein
MSFDARHNVDEVEPLAIQHLLGGTICLSGEHPGAFYPRIGRSRNFDFRNPPPGFNVTLGEETTPDDSAFQGFGHIGLERASRRSGFACIMVRI